MSEQRWALCHAVRVLGRPVSAVAREFGVSRKTAYKWLARAPGDMARAPGDMARAPGDMARAPGGVEAMADRSRRPRRSPARCGDALEQQVLSVRDRYGWGPRKIHAVLRREGVTPLPCRRTVANLLKRHGRVVQREPEPASQRFERSVPNDLWQVDHKGPVEVDRRKLLPLSVIDDHSRYALAFEPLADRTMRRSWAVLWDVFGQVGLPRQILCDNAFGTMGIDKPVGLSWFDAQCIRLGIDPLHGRPYHPQTQGKVEAFHSSAVRELIRRHARRDCEEHFRADSHAWRQVYNAQRPHEALDDQVPLSRWRPSDRKRPATMPSVIYQPGQLTRKVCLEGLVRWRGCRILLGRGIGGDWVRLEEDESELRVFYGWKQVRRLHPSQMSKDRVL
jgi:transposase InsO family protein